MKIIIGFLLLLILSCTDKKFNVNNQILDFGAFSIEAPNSWIKINRQGADSYVGIIAIDKNDTLNFDLGWYSNDLTEHVPQIIERSMLKNIDALDTTQFIIVESTKGIDPNKLKKTKVVLDTIDGYKTKVVIPKQSGIGITGIYIDSLWKSGSGNDRFNLYGTNLKPENEKIFIRVIKTIKFRKNKQN
jgi:hypothetical protein